jgi:hypothetical protein
MVLQIILEVISRLLLGISLGITTADSAPYFIKNASTHIRVNVLGHERR